MDRVALSRALFRRGSQAESKPPGTVRVYEGVAASDSEGGALTVKLSGPAITEDGGQAIGAVCTPAVKEGQTVQVAVVDGSPVVLGATGWGDDLQESVDSVRQYFWHDSEGAHVSTEEGNATGARNSLWTSVGVFFRKAANNLLALVADSEWTGLKVFDGEGNATSNEVATFGPDKIELGKNSAGSSIEFCGGNGTLGYFANSQQAYLTAPHGAVIMSDGSSDEGLSFTDAGNGTSTIGMVADHYRFDEASLTRTQLGVAVNGWVVESGASGDWTWRKYRDGTFEAWCRQSTATRHDITSPYYEFYYEAVGGWSITGLSGYTLSFVSITPEFDKAVWATVRYVGTTAFNFYLLARESISDVGRVQVYCRGTWS